MNRNLQDWRDGSPEYLVTQLNGQLGLRMTNDHACYTLARAALDKWGTRLQSVKVRQDGAITVWVRNLGIMIVQADGTYLDNRMRAGSVR